MSPPALPDAAVTYDGINRPYVRVKVRRGANDRTIVVLGRVDHDAWMSGCEKLVVRSVTASGTKTEEAFARSLVEVDYDEEIPEDLGKRVVLYHLEGDGYLIVHANAARRSIGYPRVRGATVLEEIESLRRRANDLETHASQVAREGDAAAIRLVAALAERGAR